MHLLTIDPSIDQSLQDRLIMCGALTIELTAISSSIATWKSGYRVGLFDEDGATICEGLVIYNPIEDRSHVTVLTAGCPIFMEYTLLYTIQFFASELIKPENIKNRLCLN